MILDYYITIKLLDRICLGLNYGKVEHKGLAHGGIASPRACHQLLHFDCFNFADASLESPNGLVMAACVRTRVSMVKLFILGVPPQVSRTAVG